MSLNKIFLLFYICRLFRTDFTDEFEGTDLLHGAAKIITLHLSFQVSNFDKLTLNILCWRDVNYLMIFTFPYEDSKILSVCPYPEKTNHHSFVNISPTLVIDTSMERSSRVLQHENPKILIY